MDFTNGTYRILYILIEGVYMPIGCLQNNSFSETADTISTTTRLSKNGWQEQRVTTQAFGIDFDGLVGSTDQIGVVTFDKLRQLKRARNVIQWKIETTGADPGATEFGQGQITDLSEQSAIDEFVSFSGSMVGFGEPNSLFNFIFLGYKDRVEEGGGQLASVQCTTDYINDLIDNNLYDSLKTGFNGGAGYANSIIFTLKPNDWTGDFDFSRVGNAYKVNSNGVWEQVGTNIPRDYYFNGKTCPSWLIEKETTNLILNSEPTTQENDSSNVNYVVFNWDNGFTNAVYFGDNSVSRNWYGGTVLASTEYTISAFIFMDDFSKPIPNMDFDLIISGSIANENVQVISEGNNIWRVSATSTSGVSNLGFNGILKDSSNTVKDFNVVGWQLEEGNRMTSYVKTDGNTTIRFDESLNQYPYVTNIDSVKGSVIMTTKAISNIDNEMAVVISDGTTDNEIVLRYLNNGVSAYIKVGGVVQSTFSTQIIDIRAFRKAGFSWAQDRFKFVVDGEQIGIIDTSGDTFAVDTLDRVEFTTFEGWIDDFNVYDNNLLDLEDLTSYDTYEAMALNFEYEIQ